MRFLRVLLFLLLALALAWFAALNWVPVTVRLWAPYELVIRLPVLIVAAVLIGWLPGAALHSLSHWRLARRLSRTEAELAARRSATDAVAPAATAPAPASEIAPPQAQPIAVPPAGA